MIPTNVSAFLAAFMDERMRQAVVAHANLTAVNAISFCDVFNESYSVLDWLYMLEFVLFCSFFQIIY